MEKVMLKSDWRKGWLPKPQESLEGKKLDLEELKKITE